MAETATTTTTQSTLSPHAAALLAYLRACGHRRDLAKRDHELAGVLGVPVREVIDLANELLQAGHLVLGETADPKGRWLCSSPADLSDARRHANSLGRRGIKILRRRKIVRQAIDRFDLAQPVMDTTGQYLLVPEAPAIFDN